MIPKNSPCEADNLYPLFPFFVSRSRFSRVRERYELDAALLTCLVLLLIPFSSLFGLPARFSLAHKTLATSHSVSHETALTVFVPLVTTKHDETMSRELSILFIARPILDTSGKQQPRTH